MDCLLKNNAAPVIPNAAGEGLAFSRSKGQTSLGLASEMVSPAQWSLFERQLSLLGLTPTNLADTIDLLSEAKLVANLSAFVAAWSLPKKERLALAKFVELTGNHPGHAERCDSLERILGPWLRGFFHAHFVEAATEGDAQQLKHREAARMIGLPLKLSNIARGWTHESDLSPEAALQRDARVIDLANVFLSRQKLSSDDTCAMLSLHRFPRRTCDPVRSRGLRGPEIEADAAIEFIVQAPVRHSPLLTGQEELPSRENGNLSSWLGLDCPCSIVLRWKSLPLAVVGVYPEDLSSCTIAQIQRARFAIDTDDCAARQPLIPLVYAIDWAGMLVDIAERVASEAGFERVRIPKVTSETIQRFADRNIDPENRALGIYRSTALYRRYDPSLVQDHYVKTLHELGDLQITGAGSPVANGAITQLSWASWQVA